MIRLRSGSATDVGRVRTANQDRAFEGDGLFAVADGMGGHVGGETAAQTAIDAFRSEFAGHPSVDSVVEAVRHANHAVWEAARAQSDLRGMGTTLTAMALVTVDGKEELTVVNVGDSRGYLFQEGRLSQLTSDHSLVEEMVRSGELSAEEAAVHPQRHILTRALGIEPEVEVDVWHLPPHAGDRILLCSDGLINELGNDEIASVLSGHEDPEEAASSLVSEARDAGGSDNITVVVIDVDDNGDGPGGAGGLVTSVVGAAASRAAAEGAPARDDGGRAAGEGSGADDPNPTPAHDSVLVPASQVGTATDDPEAAGSRVRVPGRSPRVTLRVVVFIAALLTVLAGIAAAVWWFGERSYFVGLQGDAVTIYKGRPGGLLWINPTVAQGTNLTTTNCPPMSGKVCVPPSAVPDLRAGKEEASLADARQYVSNLTQEATSVQSSSAGGPPAAGTTAPPPGPTPTTQKP